MGWEGREGKQSWMYCWGGGDGSREVEEHPVRMRAFQAIVRGKVVSEDAHDCFKVPLYIGNESGSGAHRDTKSCMFGCAVLCRERDLYSPERRTEFVQRKNRQKQSFLSVFQCRVTFPRASSLLLCNILSEREELVPPARMNSRPSTTPPPLLRPRTMSQPLTFENGQRGDTLHCVLISARKGERERDYPTSATMHIIISMFDLWRK